jgi:hypothetical protein
MDLLRQVPVGRIAVIVDALPVIFPIKFAVVDGAVVFRTPPGTKAATATASCPGRVRGGLLRGRWAHRLERHGPGDGVRGDRSGQPPRGGFASLDAWELDGAADHVMRIELHMERRRFTS